ncbi:MAG TPA: radical SAM protein, partial [bacterium]|nr:radical SAM protein [bacterium]
MLRDPCGRTIDYLRIAVTDYCNLRCRYCLPAGEPVRLRHEDCLRFEEMTAVARAFVALGGRKLRLTGGEPLRKRNLPALVRQLAALTPRPELVLTTNGTLLAAQAAALAAAGLQR